MGWVVLSVIAVIIISIALVTVAMATDPDTKFLSGGIAAAVIVLWIVISIFMSLHRLNTGQVGLVYSFSGKLTGSKENAGVVWLAPWQHLRRETVQIQSESFELGQGNSAVSKDQQPIFAKLVLNYQVDPKHVVDLYKHVGPNWKAKLVESRVLQDFKEVTATYPTTAITASREQLRVDTRTRLRKELSPYSIDVTDLFVSNIGFSQAYTDAIEAKQVQVQAAARAQAKVAQIEAEARQTVASAEGQAKANKILTNSISDRLIRLKSIEKLNPNVQVIYTTPGTSIFVPGSTGK
jgi:regulator of protease activity HflC (stomatin/prohibitin superfamily)